MGFKLERRTATLCFEGDFEGAELRTRLDVSMQTFFALERLQAADFDDDEQRIRAVMQYFMEHIALGWNLEEEDGTAVPCTVDAVMELPVALVAQIVPKWKEAASGIPAPLEQPSRDGDSSAEQPMLTGTS